MLAGALCLAQCVDVGHGDQIRCARAIKAEHKAWAELFYSAPGGRGWAVADEWLGLAKAKCDWGCGGEGECAELSKQVVNFA